MVIRMAGPKEVEAPPARVALSLNERPLVILEPGPDFENYTIPLSTEITSPLENEYPILRLDAKTWRPSNFIPGATDIRELGVRVDWIEFR
jgi:hypothetical protein